MNKQLWAGWRMPYIEDSKKKPEGQDQGCLFCELGTQKPGARSLILETYRSCFLVLNAFPYTSGHTMVAPFRHAGDFLGESSEARSELQAAVERARRALVSEYSPDGFNVGANLGRSAGAGVPGHLHWHVVPRWNGDTNFVPVMTQTRVIPEALPDTYSRLIRALKNEPPEGVDITGRGDGA